MIRTEDEKLKQQGSDLLAQAEEVLPNNLELCNKLAEILF
jgi:hypothetical protein